MKMQPYGQNAFGLRGTLKLRAKYYGPFRIMEKIGKLAYKFNFLMILTFTLCFM